MKNKKIILISIVGLLIIGFFSLYNSLDIPNYEKGERDNVFNSKLKKVVPQNIKDFIKNTIFVFKKVSVLERKLADREEQLVDNDIKIRELVQILINIKEFKFKKNEIKNKKLHNINLSLKTFTLPLLKSTGPRSYLSYYNQNLFLITGTGLLLYASLDNLKDEKFVFKRIDTNFEDIIGTEDSNKGYNQKGNIVKNLLIKNNKIYVSYVKKVKNKCFTNAVLVSNLKFEKIIFNQFFNTNECQPIFSIQAGGNLSDYKDNKILMTIGDYDSYESPNQRNNNPQNINSLIGKIISIDETTREHKILSMGHRNSQGLYYDKEHNVIYSTDHGPQGGDEINVNTSPDGEIKNYGWGISSYGEHYGFPDADNSDNYKKAPLNKSHSKYGFEEPIKDFTPAIGITQILKVNNSINDDYKIIVGSLGDNEEEGDMTLHILNFNKNFEETGHEKIFIGERIRDMIDLGNGNILITLDSSGSFGLIRNIY